MTRATRTLLKPLSQPQSHCLWLGLSLTALLFLQGCASQYRPVNLSLEPEAASAGYSRSQHQWRDSNEHVQLFLAFSGGGTRAAALSYGVLSELRDTHFRAGDTDHPLLAEIDSISSVSGGSFTAAYYGLYGDRIFRDYEQEFLKRKVQSALIAELFNPVNWWRLSTTAFDRTELAIEYYDKTIFKGATMGDLKDNDGPFISINSTDLTTGNRFSFTQPTFDLICSDINSYPVSRAVTASSAVPVLFNPIVLKNYGGSCQTTTHKQLDTLLGRSDLNLRQKNLVENIHTLRDSEQRPYIHLVDGGISDNLGLRALVDWNDLLGASEFAEQLLGAEISSPREVALILVNAALSPERSIDQTPKKPSTRDILTAVTDAQMLRYTLETQMLIQELVERASRQFQEDEIPVNIHVILLSFQDVEDQAKFRRLNAIQTTFELPEEQVDELIATGRELLRNNAEYKKFLHAIHGAQPQ